MIGWWSHFDDLRVASVRIRGELVMRALRASAVKAAWFDPRHPESFDTLVISKRHDAATLEIAQQFKRRGGRLIVDLCDNRFEYPATSAELEHQAQQLKQLISGADHVVTSTVELARVVRRECPQLTDLTIIGDVADDLGVIPVSPMQRMHAALRLRHSSVEIKQLRSRGYTMLIWFGHHGGAYAEAGMTDLLRIRTLLERCHRETPLALTVISNNREKYRQHIAPFALPTRYEEWHAASFDRLLQAHDISLIPVSDNAFTRCKTDNRVVTSLLNGLAVVADEIPSYRPYAAAIALNDWERQLCGYLENPMQRKAAVIVGQEIARKMTDATQIAQQWRQVFEWVNAKYSH